MKTNVFLLIALCVFVLTSCRSREYKKPYQMSNKNKTETVSSQETKTLKVVTRAQINFYHNYAQVSVVFENGWVVIKDILNLSDENIDSPIYAEKDHICKVGFDENGELVILENKTMQSMISNK